MAYTGLPGVTRRSALKMGVSISFFPVLTGARRKDVRISLLGQSLIKTDLRLLGQHHLSDFRRLFKNAAAVFTDLETVIAGPLAGQPTREGNSEVLHIGDPAVIDCLQSIGVNLVATSNNHAWDLGTGGIVSTMEALQQRGLSFAGTGLNLAEASAPGIVNKAGKVALVSAAAGAIREGAAATDNRPGVNELRRGDGGALMPMDVERYLAAIRFAKNSGAIVIAYLHSHYWEQPKSKTPEWQRALARQAVDAGAAVFVAHGVPELQGIEFYRRAPLFHGLSSFVFQSEKADDAYGPEAWQSAIAQLVVHNGDVATVDMVPVQLDSAGVQVNGRRVRGSPSLAAPMNAMAIADRLTKLSAALDGSARFGPVKFLSRGTPTLRVFDASGEHSRGGNHG